MSSLETVLADNKRWVDECQEKDPEYFSRHADGQHPDYLWIGCADSRCPVEQLLGVGPGRVFVHRNVGNLVSHKDMNCMACIEYAVNALKVKHIMVAGHYGCGAVKGGLVMPATSPGLVNLWIQDIRDVRNRHEADLRGKSPQQQHDMLVEYSVARQVFSVCTSPVVLSAWDNGQEVTVHGLVYGVGTGLLKELTPPVNSPESLGHLADKFSSSPVTSALKDQVQLHMSFEKQEALAHA